MRIIIT